MHTNACLKCGAVKPIADFYDSNKNTCKDCVKKRARAYRAENIDAVRSYDRRRGRLPSRMAAVRRRAHRYDRKKPEYINRHKRKHPEKYAARNALNNAVRDGKIERLPCQECGESGKHKNGRSKVEAHHADYSKPLDVVWLCRTCHGLHHRKD